MNHKLIVKNLGKYLHEVSVVVFGVAITLSVTIWISHKSEKRDMYLYLNAIKMELEENIKEIDEAKKYTQLEMDYSNYLQSNDKKSRNADTLLYYAKTCGNRVSRFSFSSNAFDMFKSSGMMRLLDDKELLLTLWETYENFSGLKLALDFIADYKWEMLKTELLSFVDRDIKPEDFINAPILYVFYIHDTFTGMMSQIEEALNATKETVEKLEKRK